MGGNVNVPEEAQYEVSHLCRESRDGKCFCIYCKNIFILLHPCIVFILRIQFPAPSLQLNVLTASSCFCDRYDCIQKFSGVFRAVKYPAYYGVQIRNCRANI
jgi:hypothetical protein